MTRTDGMAKFKCLDCGHIFEEGEQDAWLEDRGECFGFPSQEKFSGCPICKGDYEEVYRCKECDEWYAEDELYDGWCENCLKDSLDDSVFLEYMESCDDNGIEEFVMDYLLGGAKPPLETTDAFRQLMLKVYSERSQEDNFDKEMYGFVRGRRDIIECIIEYVMGNDPFHFANWLTGRR